MIKLLRKNFFSILVALVILYLSMASSHAFDKVPLINIPNFDKIVHFGMYFILMSVIIYENRKTLNMAGRVFVIALIPILYGVLMEILQSALTVTRSGSIFDALANCAGILVSVLIWLYMKPSIKA